MTELEALIAKYGMEKVNTLTKYPSIMTYHELNMGGVRDMLYRRAEFPGAGQRLAVTEKVDGSNYRIVTDGADYLIGSRDRFVYAKGDRVITDDAARSVIGDVEGLMYYAEDGCLTMFYGEVYGWRIQKARYNGADDKSRAFRLFDAWHIPLGVPLDSILSCSVEGIADWREANMQHWFRTETLAAFCGKAGVELVPQLGAIDADKMPMAAKDTAEWMEQYAKTKAGFGGEGAGKDFGKAEGVVIRTPDRRWIRKLRFEDYAKGAKRQFK